MDIQQLHQIFLTASGISTDTRKISPGCIFFAIKGDRFDANTFASEALQKGASHVVLDNPAYTIDERTIVVDDTFSALQELAAHHRKYLGIPIVGLTGSNGKTTTKELINAVLARKYVTGATVGNLNNYIGVPLTLLSFDKRTQIGIVEMGANHQKEIEFLCSIAQPDLGYITNFGKAHLEGFGGTEGVIKGKSELYDYLKNNGKTAIVNLQDAIQVEKTQELKLVTFGVNVNSDTRIDGVSANPFVITSYSGMSVESNLIGLYNANNINAAICLGEYFGVEPNEIKVAIESYVPTNNRSQILSKGGNEIILDAYNANPSSMSAAITNFLQLEKPAKIMILGDMFELGPESQVEHQNLVKSLVGKNIETHFIGKDFFEVQSSDPSLKFYRDFEAFVQSGVVPGLNRHTILIKGSRGMALERLLDFIQP